MKNTAIVILCLLIVEGQSQDSSKAKTPKILKRHEIGLNILPPLLALSGVSQSQPNFFNATYRYILNAHNALRATAGINVYNSNNSGDQKNAVAMGNGLTVYQTTNSRTPANLMAGIGYERIMGKRKLKHVIGVDLTYNYVSSISSSSYYGIKDSVYNNTHHADIVPIDTGRATVQKYYHKFGVTPFYSIRYPLSSKWLISASTRFNFQYYKINNGNYPAITLYDLNLSGLISEISLFYRF